MDRRWIYWTVLRFQSKRMTVVSGLERSRVFEVMTVIRGMFCYTLYIERLFCELEEKQEVYMIFGVVRQTYGV